MNAKLKKWNVVSKHHSYVQFPRYDPAFGNDNTAPICYPNAVLPPKLPTPHRLAQAPKSCSPSSGNKAVLFASVFFSFFFSHLFSRVGSGPQVDSLHCNYCSMRVCQARKIFLPWSIPRRTNSRQCTSTGRNSPKNCFRRPAAKHRIEVTIAAKKFPPYSFFSARSSHLNQKKGDGEPFVRHNLQHTLQMLALQLTIGHNFPMTSTKFRSPTYVHKF